MARPSQTGVQYRGGFRGSYIPVSVLIDNGWTFDIIDFIVGDSCVRDCESYCRMQIRIGGVLYVTWHSSELLAQYLNDCKAQQQASGEALFPLEGCKLTRGDDRGYYIVDGDDEPPTADEVRRVVDKRNRNSYRRRN